MNERKHMINPVFFLYSHRLKLVEAYKKWIKENSIADMPDSVIGYLQVIGVLDTKKALDFINSMESESDEQSPKD